MIVDNPPLVELLTDLGLEKLRNMAPSDCAPTHSTAAFNEKTDVAGTNYVERVETHDNDLSLAKIEADAKLDAFGARSKTNPEEIALVKKLDRTILVSAFESIQLISTTDSFDNSPCFGSCTSSTSSTATRLSTPSSTRWTKIWVSRVHNTTHSSPSCLWATLRAKFRPT